MPMKTKQKQNRNKTKKSKRKKRSRENRKRAKLINAGGTIGSAIGSSAGSYFGATGSEVGGIIGEKLGGVVGGVVSKITGHGQYTLHRVRRNNLVEGRMPSFGDTKPRVRNSEFLGNVSSNGDGFQNIGGGFPINPGNPDLFPWLSRMAGQYERWEPHGIIFEFRTTSATAIGSTNTALGTVSMATQYDVRKPAYSNKVEMMRAMYSVDVVSCCSAMHAVECAKGEMQRGPWYVNHDRQVSSVDDRFKDLGVFQIATSGQQAAGTIGELWVSYDISFTVPKLESESGVYQSSTWWGQPENALSALDRVTWGNDTLYQIGGTDNAYIDEVDTSYIVLRQTGNYLAYVTVEGTDLGWQDDWATSTNTTALTDAAFPSEYVDQITNSGGLNSFAGLAFHADCDGLGKKAQIRAPKLSAGLTSFTGARIAIIRLPDTLTTTPTLTKEAELAEQVRALTRLVESKGFGSSPSTQKPLGTMDGQSLVRLWNSRLAVAKTMLTDYQTEVADEELYALYAQQYFDMVRKPTDPPPTAEDFTRLRALTSVLRERE